MVFPKQVPNQNPQKKHFSCTLSYCKRQPLPQSFNSFFNFRRPEPVLESLSRHVKLDLMTHVLSPSGLFFISGSEGCIHSYPDSSPSLFLRFPFERIAYQTTALPFRLSLALCTLMKCVDVDGSRPPEMDWEPLASSGSQNSVLWKLLGLPDAKHRLSHWIAYKSLDLQCPIGVRSNSTRRMASSLAWPSRVIYI